MQWFIPVLKTQFMLHIHLNTSFIYSVPPNQLGDYPSWLIVFFYNIIFPMLGISAIALKIVLKNGKDLRRELIGVRIQPISQKQSNL